MPVRLRYLEHELQVPEGQFVIGRSSTCQLSIDDPMISRAHAVLNVTGESAVVDDLRSRNGVLVNGERVVGTRQLADGDTLTVGGQRMTIHGLSTATTKAKQSLGETWTDSSAHAGGIDMLDEPTQSVVRSRQDDDDDRTAMGGAAVVARAPDRRVHELTLVGAVAEKAIAMGRTEDAHRLLERPLRDLLARVRVPEPTPRGPASPDTVAAAAGLAVRLAVALQKGDWVDYVFDLYTARAELLPQPIIDELYTILRKLRMDGGRVRTYLAVLRERPPESFGPTGRFLISRIEGLEPLVGLK